ncbi:MAG: thermonuclease family protein [Syntrophobacteria bacterium]
MRVSLCPSETAAARESSCRRVRRGSLRPFGVLAALVLCQLAFSHVTAAPSRYLVRWVDDGDTIVLEGGERVRYLGINAPEIAHGDKPGEPYGNEARRFNRSLVLGCRVNLEFGERRRDVHGRLLAYVFLEDGTFVNGELVRVGYAHLLRRQACLRYWKLLLTLQRQALKEKRGIWSLPAVEPEDFYLGNRSSWVFHRPDCPFGLSMAPGNRIRFQSRYEAFFRGFSPCRRCRP